MVMDCQVFLTIEIQEIGLASTNRLSSKAMSLHVVERLESGEWMFTLEAETMI